MSITNPVPNNSSITSIASPKSLFRSGVTHQNKKVKNEKDNRPWLPFEADYAPVPRLVVNANNYFSSNAGLDTDEDWVKDTIAWSNLLSSDIAKGGLNGWRQNLVDVTRRLDYGWRSVSQVPMQYIQEGLRRVTRSQIAPLFNAELFPKANGYTLNETDRPLYEHLSDNQFKDLKAFDEKYCFNVEQMGDLYTALTDVSAGLRYTKIPSLLPYFTCELEKKDTITGKPTGQYETVKFQANSPLATHLKWKLAAEDTLAEQVDYFDLLHTSAQHVPYMSYGAADEHHVKLMGQLVLKANSHVKQVGTLNQLPTVYQFLIQASRGDFAVVDKNPNNQTPVLDLPLAFKVFAGGLQNEPINEELPLILGGEGSSTKKLDQLVLKAWLGGLYYACEPEDEKLANATKFGQPSPFEAVWKALWRDLKQGVDDPNVTVYTQRVGRAVEKILSGKILLRSMDEKETLTSYAFKPDAKNKYGLNAINGKQFIEDSAQALWQLQNTVKQCHQLATNKGNYQNLTPEAFQAEAKKLLDAYYEHSFDLAATLPGKNGKALDALKTLITFNKQAALGNSNPEEEGAYKLLRLVSESSHLRKNRLSSTVKASSIPQLIATVTTGLIFTGVAWNYLDNNVIQKYENDVVEKKGSVEYTGLIMAAGFLPALAAFVGMMKLDFFKKITGNRPHLHFGLVGAVALALQTVITVGMVRAFIAMKPDMPKPKTPSPAGTFTTKAELNLANVQQAFLTASQQSSSTKQASPFILNTTGVIPSSTPLNHLVKTTINPFLTANTLEARYPYTMEALK